MNAHGASVIRRMPGQRFGLATFLLASALGAAPAPEGAEGWLGRELFGDAFTEARLKLGGWTQVGYSWNDSIHESKGLGNSPVALCRDTGLQLNQAFLFFERGIRTNIIPRVTPTPGPVPEDYSFGWNVSAAYGRDGQVLQTYGLDSRWSVNFPGNYDSTRATDNKQNFLVVPQLFLQGYLPWYKGMAFCLGSWMSPFSYEIGFNWEQGPNILYSHTYALEASPVKEVGLLWAANLVNGKESGLLAVEAGIARGWSNLKDNNGSPAFNLNLRYRTGDMRTWVDFVSMWGNNQADPGRIGFPGSASWKWFGDTVNIPATRVISPRNQLRSQFGLAIIHQWTQAWKTVLEATYGKQKGDGAADTIDVVTGSGFRGASWSALNLQAQYRFSPSLAWAVRAETFRDRDGFALFPNTTARGDYNAVTTGIQYNLTRHFLFRPEVRYDWQASNHGERAFGNGTRDRQVGFNTDLMIRY